MNFKLKNHIPECFWILVATTVITIVCFVHLPENSGWNNSLPLNGRFHIPLMVIGVVATLVIWILVNASCRNEQMRKRRLLCISIALAVIQIIIIHSFYFHTDWDVQQITGAAEAMARGESVEGYGWYFQDNPNNVFLTRLFALVFFLTGTMWGADISLFPLLCLQCAGCWICGIMLFQVSIHISHKRATAIMVFLFYNILIAASPWWSIPYSDVWGLMALVAILWTSTAAPIKKKNIRAIIVAFLSVAGYYIKPQTTLIGIAILIYFAVRYRRQILRFRRPVVNIGVAIATGIVGGWIFVHIVTIGSPLHLSSSKSLGMTHYLMLGANQKSIGIYSDDDLDFSRSYDDKHERRIAQLRETAHRYKEMGVKGSLTLWSRKNVMNYSDGTFYWGNEGTFYKEIPEHKGPLARLTRNIYYNRMLEGTHYKQWAATQTAIWFGLLLTSALSILACGKRGVTKRQALQIIMLTLAFATLFHTLFECRARYLFCFTPLFIILSAEGVNSIIDSVKRAVRKQRCREELVRP
ncbi:MAG: hypothetical protein K6D59_01030 [Bacteroidales bacterium]|nr:hypothetical protein [Bacteroidales bacterium]